MELQTDNIWGAQGKMTIMESATVDIKMTKPNGSNPIRAVFGDLTVKDSGLFKVDITMSDTNPQTRTMNAAGNLTLEGSNARAEIVLNGKKPSSASRIAQNIPHIYGKLKGYYDKNAGYKVTANWNGSNGIETDPINLTYNIPSSVTDLYDKISGLVNEDDVYISVDNSGYTLEMYENNFQEVNKKDKISFAVGENSKVIYIKTTKGTDVKYYNMTILKDVAAASAALETIQGYATNSNAGGLTIAHLKAAGVKEALEGNLAAYKTAIAAEESIADLGALQTLITNSNATAAAAALETIRGYATNSNADGLTIALLETAGVKGAVSAKLEAYKTAIAGATSIVDLAALQTLITTANL